MHTNLASPKTNVEANKEQREQLRSDVACKCKKETRCAEVATTLKRTNRHSSTSNLIMKAELVADSAEANPFPYKAQKPMKKPNAVTKKNIRSSAPKHSLLARPATHQPNQPSPPRHHLETQTWETVGKGIHTGYTKRAQG